MTDLEQLLSRVDAMEQELQAFRRMTYAGGDVPSSPGGVGFTKRNVSLEPDQPLGDYPGVNPVPPPVSTIGASTVQMGANQGTGTPSNDQIPSVEQPAPPTRDQLLEILGITQADLDFLVSLRGMGIVTGVLACVDGSSATVDIVGKEE